MNLDSYEAIIFDFDGVIGKTMQDNFLAWEDAFKKINIKLNSSDYFEMEGLKAIDVARHFLKLHHHQHSPEEIVSHKESFYEKNNQFSFYPSVIELLQFLKKNKKIALVTGANRSRLDFTREKFKNPIDVFAFFDVIVSATDVKKGKPDPEPYLRALEFLKIPADKCLVIENAPLGITSAKKAGIKCVGITSTLTKEKLSEADFIFNSIADLAQSLSLSTINRN